MKPFFRVGQIWTRRDGAKVEIKRLQPASMVVQNVDLSHILTGYTVDHYGQYQARPTYYDLISLAQQSPVCWGCNGEGLVGNILETDECPFCKGTGKSPVIYIAGPMSGIPDLNFPAFHAKAAELRAAGYVVINPAEINGGADELVACASMTPEELQAHWQKCMRKDITELCTCDGIAMLDGWTRSKGATLEHHVARSLGLLVIEAAT